VSRSGLDMSEGGSANAARVNAVEVRNLSKNYPLSGSQFARFRHMLAAGKQGPDDGLWALRDVSFTVRRGEAFGIIGANGSGKSTLLQIIAGILRPTLGAVEVHGRLSALLELGSGFSHEFTGRDNVYLNGSLLGLSRDEIDARFADIVRFAGIGDFLDQPIKTYSTGMVLRLAFAVAAHVDPEILIVDEALAVGDIAFRQRCMRKIHDLRALGTTILFVSHETSDVKALCERCIWLQNGALQDLGEADEVVAKYLSATLHRETLRIEAAGQAPVPASLEEGGMDLVTGFPHPLTGHRYGDRRAAILGAELLDARGDVAPALTPFDRFLLRVSFHTEAPIDSPIAGFLVRNSRGENIFGSNTARENYPMPAAGPGENNTVEFHWSVPDLAPGSYRISLAVSDGTVEEFRVCDYIEDALEIQMAGGQADAAPVRGYFQLRCAQITVYSN
jgi:lipopolysaccharide transport system ATP-binding protein